MKRFILIIPIFALLFTGCHEDPVVYYEPFADARITPNPAYVGEDIDFLNLSQNAEFFEWDLGDGNIVPSIDVLHSYEYPGLYSVKLSAFGSRNDVNVATFRVEVIGSEITIIVKEYYDEYFISEASVLLYENLDDWNTGNVDLAIDEQFTNSYGECVFTGLREKRYYVDVFYRVGNEGYHNYFLAEDDLGFIETQIVELGYDHTFVAYVDAVIFNDKKSGSESFKRPEIRTPYMDTRAMAKATGENRPLKKNKFSKEK